MIVCDASTYHGFKLGSIEHERSLEIAREGGHDAGKIGRKSIRTWESDSLQAKPKEVIRLILDVQECALLFLCQQRFRPHCP